VWEVLDDVFLTSYFCKLVHYHQDGMELVDCVFVCFHQNSQVVLDCVHQRHHQGLEKRVEKGRLFLIFLEDETYPVLDLLEWEFSVCFLLDSWHFPTIFMLKIHSNILNIPCKDRLLLNKQIGILGHTLIDLPGVLLTINHTLPYELEVFEMLVCFFEVEKSGLYIEACHFMFICVYV